MIILSIFTALSALRGHAYAVDYAGRIDDLYFHRDQGNKLDESITSLDAVIKFEGEVKDSYLYWMRCRSLIRRGERRPKRSEKLADFDLARSDCEKAVTLDPKSPDAHFWLGVAMGRWGETKGILKAMFLIKPIRREMETTLKLDPNHGGAHHVLGEMLWQIPGFAGGDKKKALAEFELAVKLSPTHTSNYQPLAEAYLKFGRKDDAVRTLKSVEAIKDPADPAEYPENLADARKLLSTLGAK